MGVDELEVIADRGYFKKEQIKRCYDAGIKASVPRTQTSNNRARGYFERTDFKYLPDTDEYLCPAGDRLIWRFNARENGLALRRYWSSNCQSCHLKSKCTPAKQRRVTRWEHEDILDEMQDRMDRHPDRMRIRRDTIEHTFGTLKSWMGSEHFLTKTLGNVSTEMSLHVLAYNIKRVIAIMGIDGLTRAIKVPYYVDSGVNYWNKTQNGALERKLNCFS